MIPIQIHSIHGRLAWDAGLVVKHEDRAEKDVTSAPTAMARTFNTWNEIFLQMDMNLYRAKYDEANKKFLGKGKAIANLVNELQAFAKIHVVADQIPTLLATVEVFQKQEQVFAAKNSLPYEWKQLVEKYPTERDLLEYKNEVQRQLEVISQF